MKTIFYVFAALLVAGVSAEDEEFIPSLEGMQSLHIEIQNPEQLSLVRAYVGIPGFDFQRTTREEVDVLVTAENVEQFTSMLDENEIEYSVYVEDVEKQVLEEHEAQQIARFREILRNGAVDTFKRLSFNYYLTHAEVNKHLEEIANEYSDIVTLIDYGKSYEGRILRGVKVSTGLKNGKAKPAILIDGGIHAREWIAPATALFALDQLIAEESNRYLLENVDWFVLPVLNADGYAFTHASTGNRMWRKTRAINKNSSCRGVDGNRNFDIEWMSTGASSNPCRDDYAGPKPFSEIEMQHLKEFVLAQNGVIKLYLTLHSYGQYLLYPWGYTTDLPENEPTLRAVAEQAAEAIYSVRGTRYTYGTSANHLYEAAGGSDDWLMATGGAELSYTVELPGGRYGFNLPADQIKPVGTETFEGIKVFHKYVETKYP